MDVRELEIIGSVARIYSYTPELATSLALLTLLTLCGLGGLGALGALGALGTSIASHEFKVRVRVTDF